MPLTWTATGYVNWHFREHVRLCGFLPFLLRGDYPPFKALPSLLINGSLLLYCHFKFIVSHLFKCYWTWSFLHNCELSLHVLNDFSIELVIKSSWFEKLCLLHVSHRFLPPPTFSFLFYWQWFLDMWTGNIFIKANLSSFKYFLLEFVMFRDVFPTQRTGKYMPVFSSAPFPVPLGSVSLSSISSSPPRWNSLPGKCEPTDSSNKVTAALWEPAKWRFSLQRINS